MKRAQPQPQKDSKRSKSLSPVSHTLYVSNINDKIKIEALRQLLFLLFLSYGQVVDIIINWANKKMRGQAHVVFSSTLLASRALQNTQGFKFYNKNLKLDICANH